MQCRPGCAACCIVVSITGPIPGLQNTHKPAGDRCPQLDEHNRCLLFGRPERPQVCLDFKASREFCGDTDEEAFSLLASLEQCTQKP